MHSLGRWLLGLLAWAAILYASLISSQTQASDLEANTKINIVNSSN